MKENEGITLVALVVTIIVLMILAGITLTLVLGQNGLISKSLEAKNLSTNAQKATDEGLNNLYNEMLAATDGKEETTVATVKGKVLSNTDNIQIKDENQNIVTIPAGFEIAEDSPTKQEEGIVIEDGEGNQFVWIPVANIVDYKRTDFGKQYGGTSYSNYSESIPLDEQTSVSKYKGYYIGRYEAGDNVSTINKSMRTSGASVTNKVVIKEGQAPYNYITMSQSKSLAEGMKTVEGYSAITKLCSSYAWDTAINFIQKTVTEYGINSPQGNYYNTTFAYTDITGIKQTKTLNSSVLMPTGETTPVCSIYDMGGNDWEWNTESYSDTSLPCTLRGSGIGYGDYTSAPAGYRSVSIEGRSRDDIAFRISLYM